MKIIDIFYKSRSEFILWNYLGLIYVLHYILILDIIVIIYNKG